jgi:hypothetical protein
MSKLKLGTAHCLLVISARLVQKKNRREPTEKDKDVVF